MENVIIPGELSLQRILELLNTRSIALDKEAYVRIKDAHQVVLNKIEQNEVVYGVNTGFGKFSTTVIPSEDLAQLQTNLIHSHAAGVGTPFSPEVVRIILLLKINALAQGFSGVRPELIDSLIALYNHDILPVIPSKGSVGASGDLAPLAHLSLALMGEGEVVYLGTQMPARQALQKAQLETVKLQPKEGLGLINGTQVSCALALSAYFKAMSIFEGALCAGALSVDAAKGSDKPFDSRIQLIRRSPGQITVAKRLKTLLAHSEIRASHQTCDRVQDPYCLRCQPQVMGACLDQLCHVGNTLEREANAVTDNPLIFEETQEILSGGNFHAEPVALVSDSLALALSEIGALSERRIAMLCDENLSGLPSFLIQEGGVNSGFMIAHVTAAALASENKSLSHPASVDSIPTSGNQEDHVSMATFGARRCHDICDNVEGILAIELLCAAQGIDFHHPLKTSKSLKKILENIRHKVPFYSKDRVLYSDIQLIRDLLKTKTFSLEKLGIPCVF